MQHATTEPLAAPAADGAAPLTAIHAARQRMRTDREAALAALAALFRAGAPPTDMQGVYHGILVTTTLAPALDALVAAWAGRYLRWLGKRFTPTGGDNVWRRYHGRADTLFWRLNGLLRWRAVADSPERYCAFPFRTELGPGVADRDRTVLRIIYDARPNPLPVRHVLDELVALGGGVYLGKAHGCLGGRARLLAYFALVETTPDET